MAKVHAQTLLAASNLYIYTFKYDTYFTTVNVTSCYALKYRDCSLSELYVRSDC